MPKKPPRDLNESFERALRAAAKIGGPEISMGAVRLRVGRGESHRRFIGDAQIDITYKGVRTAPGGSIRPYYVALVGVNRLRHKFSLGAAPNWHEEFKTPVDEDLIDRLAQSAISFSLNEEDDAISDELTDAVKGATDKVMKADGSYEVRRTW